MKIWQKGIKYDKVGRLKALNYVKSNEEDPEDSNKMFYFSWFRLYKLIFFYIEISWKLPKWQSKIK